MKKDELSYLSKTDLFGKKQDVIQVKSFTQPDRVYEVNPKDKTCTCWEFRKGKNQICKHIRLACGLKEEGGFPISLLKSAVQKAVRRGDSERALLAAKSWMRRNSNDFFRRLAVIIVEDAILNPDYARVMELANISTRKSFVLTPEIENFALRVVEQIAKIDVRDYDFLSYSYGFKSINIVPFVPIEELGTKEAETVKALLRRSKSGGMKGDLLMLSSLTRMWAYRFKEKTITLRKLKSIYDKIPVRENYDDIRTKLTVNDIMLEAVDFHCAPLLPILLGKQWVVDLIKSHYPNDVITVDERLRNIIWRMRSGICFKKDYFTGEAIDWMVKPFNITPDADRGRYEAIYKSLEVEINNISMWFLEKNK